jgi:hypothetical protein
VRRASDKKKVGVVKAEEADILLPAFASAGTTADGRFLYKKVRHS